MPAIQLSTTSAVVSPYDVVASGTLNLPTHAMLFIGETVRNNVTTTTSIPVAHMMPPIRDDQTAIQFLGSAELDADEKRLVKDFVDTQRRVVSLIRLGKQKMAQYVIHQETDEIRPDDTLPRFSCATYVTSAYEQAAIQLVDSLLPMKTLQDLKALYTDPGMLRALDDPDQRVQIGIGNGTSWPIVMVGYLLHSLSRSPAEVRATPYRPVDGDEFFPSNPLVPLESIPSKPNIPPHGKKS